MDVRGWVRSFERRYLDLFWEFVGVFDSFAHEWQVRRSEGPAGPFTALTPWVQEIYTIRDALGPMFTKIRSLYYQLAVRKRGSVEEERFGPFCLDAPMDLIGMEITRQTRMELRYGSGSLCFVLPVRTFGVPCDSCYDDISKVRILSGCQRCFDTGFVGGYLNPIQSEIDVSEAEKEGSTRNNAEIYESNTQARMSNFPPVKRKDLIITPENVRYRVERVSRGEHRRSMYEQELLLHEIPPSDVEYLFPLPLVDIQHMSFDPDTRMRTLPQDHDDLSETELRDMLGVFGKVRVS